MPTLWQYRHFIWATALSDMRYRYAGSSLGVFWNVITPLAMLTIYTLVFNSVYLARGTGVALGAFTLYMSSGFLPWSTFVDGVNRCTNALVANGTYLKRMAIPEQVFVAQSAVSAVLSMVITIVLLVLFALALGQPPSWTWLLLPLVAVLWQGLGFGLGLLLGTLNVFFRDVGYVLGVLLQVWMWSIPVVYYESILPTAYRATLPLNPAYPFLSAFRNLYLDGQMPPIDLWSMMLAWVVVACALGWVLLRRLQPELRDAL
jgi:ABC-type polysaccharide/polyol phosphate export permease